MARQLRDGVDQFQLLCVVYNICVFLFMVDEAATIRTCPVTFVTFIRVLSGVSTPMVDQIVRTLELFAAEIAGVSELRLVDQLVLL